MKLHYPITADDYAAYNVFHYKDSKLLGKQILIVRLLFPVLLFLICLLARMDLSAYGLAALLSAVFILIIPRTLYRSVARQAKKMAGADDKGDYCGDYVLECDDAGIRGRVGTRMTECEWRGVRKIARDNARLYIYISNIQAFIVPLRAFEGDAERRAFEAFVEEKRRGAEPCAPS